MRTSLSTAARLINLVSIAGTILVIVSWRSADSAALGWTGAAMVGAAILATIGLRLYLRYGPPPAHEALTHEWAPLLPPAELIPGEMKLVDQGAPTNQQIARQSRNPADRLRHMESLGRTGTVFRRYRNAKGCHAGLRLADIHVQVIHFRDAAGALAHVTEEDAEVTARYTFFANEPWAGVGERAMLARLLTANDCRPPQPLTGIEIMFSRANYVGLALAMAVQGTLDNDQLIALTSQLASAIDERIQARVAAAQPVGA